MSAAWLLGCATPGPPRAPSLNLPERPASLTATRVGDRAVLTWTSSPNSTDGDHLRGGITAVVCRGVVTGLAKRSATPSSDANHPASPCNPVQRVAVQPGADRMEETLPPELRAGAPRALFYQVELLNERGRSAGASAPVYLAAGAVPAAVGPLQVSAAKDGAVLRWNRQGGEGASMQVTRTLIGAPSGSAAERAPAHQGAPAAMPRKGAAGTQTKTASAPAPVVLETVYGNEDPGGMVDKTVLDGGAYRYVAQRVVEVSVAGQTLLLHGEPSSPVELSFRDVFPPAPPSGLIAVPGGGLGQAPSVDLSWDPGTETDVLGYRVYRASAYNDGFGPFTRLVAPLSGPSGLVEQPAFRDMTVKSGGRYRYRVTAVDRLGNESQPSPAVEEKAPAEAVRQ